MVEFGQSVKMSLMNKKTFQKEIKKITAQIIKSYQPEKIILFGSLARGNFSEDSDVDLLIIKKILFAVDYNLPFEPLIYTQDELEKRQKLGDSFILAVLSEGKVLYEKVDRRIDISFT